MWGTVLMKRRSFRKKALCWKQTGTYLSATHSMLSVGLRLAQKNGPGQTLKVGTGLFSTRGYFAEAHAPPVDEFKNAMSTVGSQAMILTAPFSGDLDISKMHGTTLSSVSSLTVHPEPIVQFNIQIPSATSRSLHSHKYLALHILSPSQESVKLARNFSLGSKYINSQKKMDSSEATTEPAAKFTTPFERINADQWDLFENVIHNERPELLPLRTDVHLPILTKESERILICEKYKIFQVYNHEIWTCKVKDILVNVKDGSKTGGLLYFNRNFHHVGSALTDSNKSNE